jgi:adenosylcobinamide-GDP ribazoletransferase
VRAWADMIRNGGAAIVAAFQFLTRLPVPLHLNYTDELFRRSTAAYPLVGAVLGLILAGAAWTLQHSGLSTPISAVLLLVLWVALTGALHLDGLMDTADGVLSYRSRERMLEIMKDSRVGAMGVVVCVLQLLFKWALLTEWLEHPEAQAFPMLILSLLWSRWYMVTAIVCWPYARSEQSGGLGGRFRGLGTAQLLLSSAIAVALSAWLLLTTGTLLEAIVLGVLYAGIATLAGAGMSIYLARKLGGLTGDTYGALNEMLESLLLLLAIILLS